MSYNAITFVAFEVLTAANMNILAANDASFNDATGIAAGALADRLVDDGSIKSIAFAPAGNTDYSTGSFGTWITLGNITVPSWATSVFLVGNISSVYGVTNTQQTSVRWKIGSATGIEMRLMGTGTATGVTYASSHAEAITLSGTGSQSVIIEAKRDSGTGGIRADTSSDFTALMFFVK